MASKKQFADMENAIMLLEEKVEKLEDDHVTMKQMISMQNALIENLQMMIKMMSQQTLTMSVKTPIGTLSPESFIGGSIQSQEHEPRHHDSVEGQTIMQKGGIIAQGGLKHRMSRVI